MKKILFVCSGNTCRSPMAEFLLKDKLIKMGIEDIEVKSAGLAAFFPQPATKNAQIVMKEIGIDISKHVSKLINADLIKNSNLILTMEKDHKKSIVNIYPSAMDRVFTLKEFVNGKSSDLDVKDPYGQDIKVYRQCRDEIDELIQKLLARLHDL